jgi:uncharacterized membrane protein YphA (DoxX/SURF4 family)
MFTRSQLKWIFLALVALRLIVGFHLLTECKTKLAKRNWTAAPCFAGAKGPFAPLFHGLMPDWNYRETLCVVRPAASVGDANTSLVANRPASSPSAAGYVVDPYRAFGQWDLFLEDILMGYRLKQSELGERVARFAREVAQLSEEIEAAEANDDRSLVPELTRQRQQRIELQRKLEKADPLVDLLEIVGRRRDQLNEYLLFPTHRDEILKSVDDEDRLAGFIRDGENRSRSGRDVESLRQQIETIKSDIRAVRGKHAVEVQGIWDGLEQEMNAYGQSLSSPLESGWAMSQQVTLRKPFELNPTHQLYWINTIVPYFDVTVGVLLLLGLFTRITSLAAAGFLLGIIVTQPLWVPGHDPKIIWNLVEFGALLVLAATVAGRFGGLDYFLHMLFGRSEEMRSGGTGDSQGVTTAGN